jgi:hypothetical protein
VRLLFDSNNSSKTCAASANSTCQCYQEVCRPPSPRGPQPVESAAVSQTNSKLTIPAAESYGVGAEVVCESGGKYVAAIVVNQLADGQHTVGNHLNCLDLTFNFRFH